jgi:hypothetical protein
MPVPEPRAPDVIVMNALLLTAVQLQPACVITVTVAGPPTAAKPALVGLIAKEQGGGFGTDPPINENSSRLGEPVPASVTLFGVEPLMIAAVTVAGEALGFVSRNSAATPATCGDAIDVPEIVFIAVSLVFHDDVMSLPGAKMSRQVPKFENEERASLIVVAPTVIASATRAGEKLQAF